MLVGIDGCKGGWVAAISADSLATVRFAVACSISELNLPEDCTVGIDIPIGLSGSRARGCDEAARRLLGPGQGSRVFPAPVRATLTGSTYEECCRLSIAASGKSLSKQSHAILCKIKEIDDWVTPERQQRVREVHPEVCFCVLNGKPLLHSKKTTDGQRERLEILGLHGVRFDSAAERNMLGPPQLAVDDLIDAAVALVTAHRISRGVATVIGNGELDARGLRMEMLA